MKADEAWLALARSEAWSDRVRAGQELALRAGEKEVDAALLQLLLSRGDTAVVARTADALLTVGNLAALRVFMAAWSMARPPQADHLIGALSGALFEASLVRERADRFRADITKLLNDDDENVRRGARLLFDRVIAALPQ